MVIISLGWDESPIHITSVKRESEPSIASGFGCLCFDGRATSMVIVNLTEKDPTSRLTGCISIALDDLPADAGKRAKGGGHLLAVRAVSSR